MSTGSPSPLRKGRISEATGDSLERALIGKDVRLRLRCRRTSNRHGERHRGGHRMTGPDELPVDDWSVLR